ncbi:hypothetical protein CVT24_012830 [Panaeolus cyanescens]|uniref:Prolyl 4-hydroxylase alpha subunit Fe(2+) 2OG dioxygenase domain-containing protein n=1 Tax=Panaeolus cyanescens TaxID=181874 RepID=A0A409YJS3_9AGAR|nr:hypothetical protein CVT24_012830 [Panaeolus cyanescens]
MNSDKKSDSHNETFKESSRDLNYQLLDVLQTEFSVLETYHYHSTEPGAPNPGLTIEDIGLIGLPLSERDAQSIINRASQSSNTLPTNNLATPDSWEIDPALVSFVNPAWETFITGVVTKVLATLGLACGYRDPTTVCKLHKLRLQKQGSCILPHLEVSHSNAMFATVTIVLPSTFQGGQICLAHAGRSTVLDIAPQSMFNISALAWYSGVMHEALPITSGHRLTLSYNLIHTSTVTEKPEIPDPTQGPLKDLREILERWKNDQYKDMLNPPLFAYMLSGSYRWHDRMHVLQGLESEDVDMLTHVVPVMDEMGFVLCLADLVKTESGDGVVDHRVWYDYTPGNDKETAEMGEIDSEYIVLSNLMRINHNFVTRSIGGSLTLKPNALIPPSAFDHLDPDESQYDGHDGRYNPGRMHQMYNCSALVIFRKEDEISTIQKIGGTSAIIRYLPTTTFPTVVAQKVVDDALNTSVHKVDNPTAIAILRHSLSWKQHSTWNKAIPFVADLKDIKSAISQALQTFAPDLITNGIIPRTASCANAYGFHIALFDALKKQDKLVQDAVKSRGDSLQRAILQCLSGATAQWNAPLPPTRNYFAYHSQWLSPAELLGHIKNLVKLCFENKSPETCVQLFD